MDVAVVTHLFVPIVAILIIVIPQVHQAPRWTLVTFSVLTFLPLRICAGYSPPGAALPLTVTEVCAVALTVVLAYGLNNSIRELEVAIVRIIVGPTTELTSSLSDGQDDMHRELRRARFFGRPLALMILGIEDGSLQVTLDRVIEEVQQALANHYILVQVSKILCDKLEDYNIIALQGNRFCILLPEMTPEMVHHLTNDIRRAVSEGVGISLQMGTASFPNDGTTFDSLMEKAIIDLTQAQDHDIVRASEAT
jgi:GGDEF domain-containing protein